VIPPLLRHDDNDDDFDDDYDDDYNDGDYDDDYDDYDGCGLNCWWMLVL
jgi:hypothetical protein